VRESVFPPLREALLGALTVHELVRDFPELLRALEAAGVPFQEVGGQPLTSVTGTSPRRTTPSPEELLAAVAWRGHRRGREGV